MTPPLQIRFGEYTVLRSVDPADDGPTPKSAVYTIRRPDGSEMCCGVTWADVERLIDRDRATRRDVEPPQSDRPTPPPAGG
ncbi:MAG: hypothetical protein QM770_06180 [Tepidisphaeraceae bacterium]